MFYVSKHAFKAYLALLLVYIGPRSHISYFLKVLLRSHFLFEHFLFVILGVHQCVRTHTHAYNKARQTNRLHDKKRLIKGNVSCSSCYTCV